MNVQLRRHNRTFTRENYTTTNERNDSRPNKFLHSNYTTQPKSTTPNRSRLPGLNLSGTTPINKERSNKSLAIEHPSRMRTPSLNQTGEIRTKSHIGEESKAHAGTIILEAQGNEIEEVGEPSMPQIDVGKAMTLSYNQYLYHKLLEKERLKVARVKANQLEDEKRNTFRQKFLEKEKKKEMVLSNLLQNKLKRAKEIEEQRKDKQQKLEELEQIYFTKSRERFRSLLSRMERTDSNKKEIDMNKSLRITARNGLISSRQRARVEKEIQENSILITQNSLAELENKQTLNSARKKKHIEEKINRSHVYLRGVTEKGMMANQAKVSKQNEYLQKYAKKMDKARSRSLMVTPKGTETNEDYHEERSGFAVRYEQVQQNNEELAKKRLQNYKEKERLLKERLEKRRLEIAEYVNEKKDEWSFKLGVVKQNARANSVDYGEKTEVRMTTYKMRVNNLMANRIDRKNKLERLGKTFTFETSSKSNLFITGTEPSKLR